MNAQQQEELLERYRKMTPKDRMGWVLVLWAQCERLERFRASVLNAQVEYYKDQPDHPCKADSQVV